MALITNGGSPAVTAERADIERTLASVQPLPPPSEAPALVLLVGPPGSGKSTVARALSERTAMAVLDLDVVRALLVEDPRYSFEETRLVSRAVRLAAGELLQRGVTVLVDAPNLTHWERQPLYSQAEQHGARLVVVQVTAPMQLMQDRIRRLMRSDQQAAAPAIEDHQRMAGRQEPITRAHLNVDTSRDIAAFIEGLARDLERPATGQPGRG